MKKSELLQLIKCTLKNKNKINMKINQSLESYFWTNNKLNPDIRIKLLKIAESFYKNSEIELTVHDIIFTGSMAGFNYNEKSDIDLHLIFNFKDIDENTTLVKNWLLTKANQWNLNHDITIKGYEVQVYTEDVLDKNISNGIYSILNDKWIQEPKQNEVSTVNVSNVDGITLKISKYIDNLIHQFETNNSPEDAEKVNNKIKELKKKLVDMRRSSLDLYGIYGAGNLIYKKLRNDGYFEKIKVLQNSSYDKIYTENKLNETNLRKATATQLLNMNREFPDVNASVYYRVNDNKEYIAAGFSGKKDKADFYYRFKNKERFEKYIEDYANGIRTNIESKLKYREEKKIKATDMYDKINVDDIVYTSWGYDQTNINFYQVTGKFGNNSLKVREIDDKESTEHNTDISSMAGYKVPIKDKFVDSEKTIRVMTGYLKIDNHIAYIWDGKPKYYSWYA